MATHQARSLTRPLTLTHLCIFQKNNIYHVKPYLNMHTKFWGDRAVYTWLPGRIWPEVAHWIAPSALKQVSSLLLHVCCTRQVDTMCM